MRRSRAFVQHIRDWQLEQVRLLSRKPYSDLAALPQRSPLAAPAKFKACMFFIVRTSGERGGVVIDVQEVITNPARPSVVPGIPRYLRSKVLEAAFGTQRFEMLPSGKVIWERFVHDPWD